MDRPPTPTATTGLILSGGGARAAYQVGVLQAVAEMHAPHAHGNRLPYDIICGTSAGAINAAALASRADDSAEAIAQLHRVWANFHVDQVYRAQWLDMFSSGAKWLSTLSMGWLGSPNHLRPRSLLDNSPLSTLLEAQIPLSQVHDHLNNGHLQALAITASGYESGAHVTFYQSNRDITPWVRNARHAHVCRLSHDHLMASAAIPFIFPAVALHGPFGHEFFGDGSMRQSAPISPAIHLGAQRVLIVGTGMPAEPQARTDPPPYPTMAKVAGHALSSIFQDFLAADVERAQRINLTLKLIPEHLRAHTQLHPVDVLHIAPSQPLESVAAPHLKALPRTVRSLMRTLGSNGQQAQGNALLSYLLFESDYTGALIEMGHRDAWAQATEIQSFFGW